MILYMTKASPAIDPVKVAPIKSWNISILMNGITLESKKIPEGMFFLKFLFAFLLPSKAKNAFRY
jgi:hypothetical protein